MFKTATLFLILCAGPVIADSCPDRYRFVDFGREGRDGVVRRGGTILRAFDEGGQNLLVPESTRCLDVEEVAKDGRALPIPVVTAVEIDLDVAGLNLNVLKLEAVADSTPVAGAAAVPHQQALARAGTTTTRGDDFLCANAPLSENFSCQMLSPYGGNAPLVVYCDAQRCDMPVMARDSQLFAAAAWSRTSRDRIQAGPEISRTLNLIHDFLERQF